MKEIKFRAWYNGKMIQNVCPYSENEIVVYEPYNSGLQDVDSIMQYTGLKDKNGKEIYEGDIVKYSLEDCSQKWTGIVMYDEENCMYLGYLTHSKWYGEKIEPKSYGKSLNLSNNIEIIGNIYENPNLLKTGIK